MCRATQRTGTTAPKLIWLRIDSRSWNFPANAQIIHWFAKVSQRHYTTYNVFGLLRWITFFVPSGGWTLAHRRTNTPRHWAKKLLEGASWSGKWFCGILWVYSLSQMTVCMNLCIVADHVHPYMQITLSKHDGIFYHGKETTHTTEIARKTQYWGPPNSLDPIQNIWGTSIGRFNPCIHQQ